MHRRRGPLLAASILLCAALAGACTRGHEGPVVFSGEPRPEPPPQHIVEALERDEQGRFSTLLELADDDAVVEALTGPGPVTLFAPTDAAFAALGASPAQLGADPEELGRTLAQHVALLDVSFSVPDYVIDGLYEGRVPPEEAGLVIATDIALVESLSGTDLLVDGRARQVSVRDQPGSASVVEADIRAPNGYIQVIDTVLSPPPAAPAT